MENNLLQCGHKQNNDLDMFCSKCFKMYVPTYIPYLISVILLTFVFFSPNLSPIKEIFTRPFLILSMTIMFLLFLIISVLRNRWLELLFNIFTIIPILTIYLIIEPISTIPILKNLDLILSIALLFQFFSFLFTLIYGLSDAPKYSQINELHKGSFWVILAFIISAVLTLFEIELKFLINTIPETEFKKFLDNMLYWIEFISEYRAYMVATVSGLVIILSTIKSLKSSLEIKKVDFYKGNISESDNVFINFEKNISKLILTILSVIATVGLVTLKILMIIGKEIFVILKGLLIRAFLLFLRIIRFIGIVALTIVFYHFAFGFSLNVDALWSNFTFLGPSKDFWFEILINHLVLIFTSLGILTFSYRKWKLFEPENLTLKYSFSLVFGKWDELQSSMKSITFSSLMLPVYIALSFLGAWAIINSILYFVNGNLNSIGILFVSSIALILILGLILIFKDQFQKKTIH